MNSETKPALRRQRKSIISAISDISDTSETLHEFENDGESQKKDEEISDFAVEQRRGLKRVLFVPYDHFWETTLTIIAYWSTLITILAIVEEDNILKKILRGLDYVFDGMFLFDNILVILSKILLVSIPLVCHRRPVLIVVCELISVIPIDLLEYILPNLDKYSDLLLLKDLLKLPRIFLYFICRRIAIGQNQVLLLFMLLFFTSSTLILVSFVTIYVIVNCIKFTCSLEEIMEYFSLSSSISAAINFAAYPDRVELQIFAIICSIIAYYLICILPVSQLINVYHAKFYHKYLYLYKVYRIKNKLNNVLHSPPLLKTQILNFYDIFWKMRKGYPDDNKIYAILPFALRQDVAIDVNWYAFKHSKLFQNLHVSFLRAVSLVFRQEFLFPGDFLYRKNDSKTKMVYIISGVLQVLSDEDNETSLISFTAGTCFGELSLVMPYSTSIAVVCKEYCRIQVLDMKDYTQVAKNFPAEASSIKKSILSRLEKAKLLLKITDLTVQQHGDDENKKITLMWIKSTLQRMMMSKSSSSHELQNIYLREEHSREKFTQMHFYANYLDLLTIPQGNFSTPDTVFMRPYFPWILKPDTIVTRTWDNVMCVVIAFAGVIIPYFAFVEPNTSFWYDPFVYFVTLIYWLDLLISLTIAVRTTQEFFVKFSKIFVYRIEQVNFWVDVLAAYPLENHGYIVFRKISSQKLACLNINRLLKMWRINKVLDRYLTRHGWLMIFVSYTKFFAIYAYISYFSGCILYSINCFSNVCYISVEGNNMVQKMLWFFSDAAHIVTATGLESRYSDQDFFYYMYVSLMYIAIFLYVFIIGHVCCIQIFQRYPLINLQERYSTILAVLTAHGVKKIYCRRIVSLIRTEWRTNGGEVYVFPSGLMTELPERSYATLKENAIADFVKNIPLFENLPEDMIYPVCLSSTIVTFPPGEVLSYAGINDDLFYCIINGYCELISPLTRTREKMVGPNDIVYLLETCVRSPKIHTAITKTYCQIIMFNFSKILNTFTIYPEYLEDLHNVIRACDLQENLESLCSRGSQNMSYELGHNADNQKSFCKFGYGLAKDSSEEYEYYVPFDNLGVLSFVNIILLRITIMPFGKFLFFWEALRSIFAVVSSLLFVINPIGTCSSCELIYLLYVLDVTAWIDIYVRFHVCYYNTKGILVTHPLKTAVHYVTHGFLIDLIAVFPVHFFLPKRNIFKNKLLTLLQCNRVLQLHRFYGLSKAAETLFLHPKKIVIVLKYFVLFLIISNLLAALLTNIDCDFHINIKGNRIFEKGVVCSKQSWYINSKFSKPFSPIFVHVTTLYFVTTRITIVGMQGFLSVQILDTVFQTIIVFIGCLLCMFVAAKIMSTCSTRDITQLKHSNSLKILVKFMKNNSVSMALQEEVIRHYKLKWQRKKGKELYELVKQFQKAIRQDVLYEVYGRVLEDNSIFTEEAKSFYQSILMESMHETLVTGSDIALVSDIKSTMHIIIKGHVGVIAPDGSKLTTLGIGSMFGNLDNYSSVRQTVGYRAYGHIEILTINSLKFHEVLQRFPHLNSKFKVLTAMHIDFLPGRQIRELNSTIVETSPSEIHQYGIRTCTVKPWVFYPTSVGMLAWKIIVLIFGCIVNNFVGMYFRTLEVDSLILVALLYITDVIFIIDIFVRYRTAYESDIGIIITDVLQIRKKVHEDKVGTIVSYASAVPLDIIAWILPYKYDKQRRIYGILILNRILRVVYVHKFIERVKTKINVHILLIDTIHLLFWASILYHTVTCLTINLSCLLDVNMNPPMDCHYLKNGTQQEKANMYISSLYVVVLCLHHCGQSVINPASMTMVLFFIILMILSVIYTASILTYLYGTIKMMTFSHWIFEKQYLDLMQGMEHRHASLNLTKGVGLYLKLLWKKYRGPVFPIFLRDAPTCLRDKIVNECFQHHLLKNALFKNCHKDFLRQVIPFVRIRAYFSDNYVIYEGNVNNCMYFIHEGEILILSKDTVHKEKHIGKLIVGQSFGVLQGLNKGTPHQYTFKSIGNSVILVLQKKRWQHLLDYFPASKHEIYKAANEYIGY